MPQINRIRVNNVKYNFGTQVYDDFMMRFNCRNTIYDLANGGGKSLLMLLLLQNLIPNCTLDDKQPIEKLFRPGSGNTVIHSLVEWKLDPCFQKDNFKYMTTGFCARAGKSSDDDSLQDGAAQKGTASVEYFNYCIFYREFGDNDIKNLPLASGGEKITYNGLKAYLRDLEKKDFNVSVKIFDKKGDYQNFITGYGLYESHWEIVRGINKTEGHVRTYFESNYRTSRKVVEDLLIEEIIQKSFNNSLAVDNDDDSMARTLLDIKDKLVELSKKHHSINDYDNQIQALEEFSEYIKTFGEMYEKKDALKSRLMNMAYLCNAQAKKQDEIIDKLDEKINELNAAMEQEHINIQTAEVMEEEKALKQVKELEEKLFLGLNSADEKIKAEREKLLKLEAAGDYKDYLSYQKEMLKAKEALDNIQRGKPEILEELKAYANELAIRKEADLKILNDKLSKLVDERNKADLSYNEYRKKLHDIQMEIAGVVSRIAMTEEKIKDSKEELKSAMEDAQILVGEGAAKNAAILEVQLTEKEESLLNLNKENQDITDKITKVKSQLASTDALVTMLLGQLSEDEKNAQKRDLIEKKLGELRNIYGTSDYAALLERIQKTLDENRKKLSEEVKRSDELKNFVENAKNGNFYFENAQRIRLKEYLLATYGEDVCEGRDWVKSLDRGQRRDVIRRASFIEYAFVVKNDFYRIKEDMFISEFESDGAIIPIVSEEILRETKHEINHELITFAMRDLEFLRDPVLREKRIKIALDEIENMQPDIEKLSDRCKIIENDLMTVIKNEAILSVSGVNPFDTKAKIDALSKDRKIQEEVLDKLLASDIELKNNKVQIANVIEDMEKRYEASLKASQIFAELSVLYKALETAGTCKRKLEGESLALQESVNSKMSLLNERISKYEEAVKAVSVTENEMETVIGPATGESTFAIENVKNLSMDELEIRFSGLKDAMNSDISGSKDKESLINHYMQSMEKAKTNIDYKGLSFEEIESEFNAGKLEAVDGQTLRRVRERILDIEKSVAKDREEYASMSAMKNRLEGSIDHGKSQIVEKYGEYKTFECDNTAVYIGQHKELILKQKKDVQEILKDKKEQQRSARELFASQKNVERIIRNSGMELPDDLMVIKTTVVDDDINKCDEVAEDFDSLIKLEYKRREEFEKRKQILVKNIKEFDGAELAREIEVSVNVPESKNSVDDLAASIEETNGFILLEKQRVSESIEDMERIKDNFENRCIQTCSNIKTELERLPKLSTITMDDEVISIIGLTIPYVPQEQYKQRMSDYIDETVVMAESFKDRLERLKFIRNRLSWKRLFSVIVTDMNGVRINLYKRERIKDQSRYLRYEEAVGSTGQSQGIYIQFLIGIINYISSLNTAPGSGVTGKTIFIDNPFGAAKDIYIWEPIFKLLKTNHVQLIVPARGATPAITSRFDVNYILGQKLVENRQQTVVVDYFSDTGNMELEYTRMNYEQASFEFTTN